MAGVAGPRSLGAALPAAAPGSRKRKSKMTALRISQENIMDIGSSGGIDIGQLFQNATNGLSQDGQALQAKMDQISASGEVDQMQLLELQFAMGQYNAKLETISSVTKSIQDMLKSLAQRTG